MSCEDGVCGTGGWNGPLPGDPSNNGTISATPAFGGIDVTWTFPTTNPYAVAHTRLYRGVSPVFDAALMLGDNVGGSFYYDRVGPPTTYFYWIQFVSINGTYLEPIGPASAVGRSAIQETIELLTEQIDMGMLAQSLKEQIALIPMIDDKIFQEIQDRLADNLALSDAIGQVQNVSDETRSFLLTEVTQRQTANTAMVLSINALFAQAAGNAADINEERLVRVSQDEALASQIETLAASMANGDADITAAIAAERVVRVNAEGALAQDIVTLFAESDANQAAIINEQTVRADENSATASQINDLYAAISQVNGATTTAIQAAIETERTVRVSAEEALASDITTLFSQYGDVNAAIQTEATTRATADTANASLITTVQSALTDMIDDTLATVQNEATTRASADNVLAGQISTAQTSLAGNIASVQTSLESSISIVDGKVFSIGALYTAKVNVNGLVGGFGVYNDGAEVEAGFDVDSFWIGRTQTNKRKPFIVVGDETFIDQAVINQLTFTKLRSEDGAVIVENGKLKAMYIDTAGIVVKNIDTRITGATNARTEITNAGIYVYDGIQALPRVELGLLL